MSPLAHCLWLCLTPARRIGDNFELCYNSRMEQNIVIYIGIWKTLGIIATIIGGVAWGAWYASSRLTRVETKVDGFETRLTSLEGRLDNAFASGSPVSLLPKGEIIIKESGLKKYIEDNKEKLLSQCEKDDNMKNPYDIQETSFKFFDQYNFGEFEKNLKDSAYKHGIGMEVMRRIAGIYLRDICLKKHGFTPQDLDKPKTN